MTIMLAEADQVLELLKSQIATQDFYIKSMAGGFAVVGGWFAYKFITGMAERVQADTDLAASNREMTAALQAQTVAFQAMTVQLASERSGKG